MALRAGKPAQIGSQIGRTSSDPATGQSTLQDNALL